MGRKGGNGVPRIFWDDNRTGYLGKRVALGGEKRWENDFRHGRQTPVRENAPTGTQREGKTNPGGTLSRYREPIGGGRSCAPEGSSTLIACARPQIDSFKERWGEANKRPFKKRRSKNGPEKRGKKKGYGISEGPYREAERAQNT